MGLGDGLVARVLERLGLAHADRGAAGLASVFHAWCHTVPWDNVQKRISIAEGRAMLAGAEPAEFIGNFLRHGTGGTCWPSAGGLHALLRGLGFDARRAVGAMQVFRYGRHPSHGTTIVRADGEDWLVDSSILHEQPLPLRRGERTSVASPPHEVTAEPHPDGLWLVWWAAHDRDERIPLLIYEDDVPHGRFLERYEASRERGFSYSLILRAGRPGGVLSLTSTERAFKRRDGVIERAPVADRVAALVAAGLSEDAARRLPPDVEAPAR